MLKEPVMAILPIKVKTNDVVVIEDSTPVTKKTDLLSQELLKIGVSLYIEKERWVLSGYSGLFPHQWPPRADTRANERY